MLSIRASTHALNPPRPPFPRSFGCYLIHHRAPSVLGISLYRSRRSLRIGSSVHPPFPTSTTCVCIGLLHRCDCTDEEGGGLTSRTYDSLLAVTSPFPASTTRTRTDLLMLTPSAATLAPTGRRVGTCTRANVVKAQRRRVTR
jgi:hypothetical protein